MSRSIQNFLYVGQVVKCFQGSNKPIVKVRVPKMSLDKKLLMYFPRKKDFLCVDSENNAQVGDIVVIRNLDEYDPLNNFHKLDFILYKSGAVRDPITGRLCRGTQFVDEEARKVEQSKRVVEELTVTTKVEL